jgi:hypothetical protein
MKRFLLVLITSLIGIAIASYADAAAQVCDAGVEFGKNRIRLMKSFAPGQFTNPSHNDPIADGDSSNSVVQNYIGTLERAFCIASSDVRTAFNNLDYLFLTNDTRWNKEGPEGVWSEKRGMKYIIIPTVFLDNISKTQPLSSEENDLTTRVFGVSSFSTFSDNGATTREAAALAILAHELGHVVFAATNADGRHKGGNPRNLPVPGSCFDDSILSAWDASKFKQRRWVKFGDVNGNVYGDSQIKFGSMTMTMMTYLYQHTPLVSLFASASPEEDFVETFKYHALASATGSLDLSIDGISNAVSRAKPSSGTGNTIGAKVNCIFTVLLPTMPGPQVNP